jgi:hypothetical protein
MMSDMADFMILPNVKGEPWLLLASGSAFSF